jgi:U8 snoRNA-decapping enzyme
MQMRFDGHLGFPGGLVDAEEDPTLAVNRELSEELYSSRESLFSVEDSDLLAVHHSADKDLLLYFYVKELPLESVVELEKRSVEAPDYGQEVNFSFKRDYIRSSMRL